MSEKNEVDRFTVRNQKGGELTIIKHQPYETINGFQRKKLPWYETTKGIKVNIKDKKFYPINEPDVPYEKVH